MNTCVVRLSYLLQLFTASFVTYASGDSTTRDLPVALTGLERVATYKPAQGDHHTLAVPARRPASARRATSRATYIPIAAPPQIMSDNGR
jgi:hypothetical protein